MTEGSWGGGQGSTTPGERRIDAPLASPRPADGPAPIAILTERLRADVEAASDRLVAQELQIQALRGQAEGRASSEAQDLAELRKVRAQALDLRSQRDRALADAAALARRVADLEAELARREAESLHPPARLPVLARDVARWMAGVESEGPAPTPVTAVPVGPPPLPPTIDDLDTVDRYFDLVHGFAQLQPPQGKPLHTLFDERRFQVFQARLREAGQLAERLLSQYERSRTNKEFLWHLMVAKKSDEVRKKKW